MELRTLFEIGGCAILLFSMSLLYGYGVLVKKILYLRNNDKTVSIMYHELMGMYMGNKNISKMIQKMDEENGKFSKYLFVINALIDKSIAAEQHLYPKLVKEGFIKKGDLDKATLEDVIKKIEGEKKGEINGHQK